MKLINSIIIAAFLIFQFCTIVESSEEIWIETQIVSGTDIELNRRYSGGLSLSLYDNSHDNYSTILSGGFFALVQFDDDSTNDYTGYEFTLKIATKGKYSLYGGGGLLFGDAEFCTILDDDSEDCIENKVFGFFPEMGLNVRIFDKVFIGLYSRKYIFPNDIEDFVGVGITIGVLLS